MDSPWLSQLRKGLVELCVLAVLQGREVHGYQILKELGEIDGLAISESTLYPLLARLLADELVTVRTSDESSGRPRRYYRLTETGEARLRERVAIWRGMKQAVEGLLHSTMREGAADGRRNRS